MRGAIKGHAFSTVNLRLMIYISTEDFVDKLWINIGAKIKSVQNLGEGAIKSLNIVANH